jgi:hypothetical protein
VIGPVGRIKSTIYSTGEVEEEKKAMLFLLCGAISLTGDVIMFY